MENNEDEPDDVKKATPVESAILDGDRDETKQSIKGTKPKSAPATLNDREETKVGRCNVYRSKLSSPVVKTKKPCHPKAEIICRENLSKDEYIEVLSRPKKSRGLSCKHEAKVEQTDNSSNRRYASGRKPSCKEKAALPRPLSQRLEELAKPKPSHVMDLLQTWGSRLRPEIIDNVQKSLEENCVMSPEQMEAYYNETEKEDCGRVHRLRRKKCRAQKEKKKVPCDDHMDQQAVCEEYEMAQRFMRHIISHLKNCQFAPEDYYDLTEVILSQLGNVLDYRPSGDGDRRFQMMFMLANGIASWVHGLNVAITEKLAKQQAQDAEDEIETEESEDEDEREKGLRAEMAEVTEGEEDEDEQDEGKEKEENIEKESNEGEEVKEEKEKGEETMEDTEMNNEANEEETALEMEIGNDVAGLENENETTGNDEGVNEKLESDEKGLTMETGVEELSEDLAKVREEPEPEAESSEMDEEFKPEDDVEEKEEYWEEEMMEELAMTEEETIEDLPSIQSIVEPGLAIERLGEGDLFASEIPFVTFGKIMEIIVKFLEKFEEAETTEVRRRLQNAILKKLTKLVLAEAPDALDSNMKAVLEVLAENIAVFMEDSLPSSKVADIETMAPEIESTEVRSWGHWLETVMDNATNWGKWIHEKVGEAEEKARTKVTRGDWQDWTRTVNSEALRWRMFNLDTKHLMHHADLNLTHKKVVHRGAGIGSGKVMGSARLAPYPEKDEAEINAYDLYEETKSLDQNVKITNDYLQEDES